MPSKTRFYIQAEHSFKKANECDYWTCLLRDSDFISHATALDLLTDNVEIIKMLTVSINTAKNNLH